MNSLSLIGFLISFSMKSESTLFSSVKIITPVGDAAHRLLLQPISRVGRLRSMGGIHHFCGVVRDSVCAAVCAQRVVEKGAKDYYRWLSKLANNER